MNRQHPAFTSLAELPLALPGEHQRLNAALAAATVRQLQPQLPVTAAHVRDGLAHVHWPGRLQLVTLANGHRLLLDGAHNLAGFASLEQALARYFPGTPLNLVLGILEDKDWPHMGGVLAPLARRIFCVPVRSERTASPAGLADSCRAANPGAEVRVCASVPEAMAESTRDPFTLVAGSLYLVGEAMEWLGLSPTAGASESEAHLNESFTRNA